MARYEQYKDCDFGGIWQVPAHWEIVPLKSIFRFVRGLSITKANLQEEGIPVISYGQIHSKENSGYYLNEALYRFVSPDYLHGGQQSLVTENDFLFADTSEDLEGCGNCVFVDRMVDNLFAGYHTIVARPAQPNHNFKYISFLFMSQAWRTCLRKKVNGVKVFSVTQSILKQQPILLPPFDEQKAIAAYLDSEVSKIDKAIKQQQKMIELLNERRQIIISEAVSKGVNPDVQMKDSGIDWVGVIPEHWEVRRLKTLMSVRDERNDNPDEMLLSVYTALGVRPRKELEERGNKASTVINYKKVRRGDLIVNRLLAWMGAYGLSDYQGVTSPDYDVYCFNSTCFNPYYELMFRNSRFKGDCFKYGHGIMLMRWRTYPSEFLNIKVPYPPYDEQVLIYGVLRPEIDKISLQIEQREKIIKRLSERKRIIINDVVTGKVKVS